MVFAEHREYRPGDDPRRLDWRAYARSDRPVIRRFEQEARLEATLVLDRSPSMNWSGFDESPERKSDYAATLLACIAYLLSGQGDALAFRALGLGTHDDLVSSSRRSHLLALFERLVAAPTDSPGSLGEELTAVAENTPARSLLVVASDLLHGANEVEALPFGLLTSRGRQAILLHVLHRDEVEPPFRHAARFAGLEGEGEVEADMGRVGNAYRATLENYCSTLRDRCTGAGIRYIRAISDRPPIEALVPILQGGR